MDSGTSLLSKESTAATRIMSRRGPLHTCGVSILVIIHRAYTKAQALGGPIGSMTKMIATLAASACPIIYAIQYQWLAFLSFVDDHILAVENMVETLFPPSTHLFNKIDELVHTAETLPGKFDDAVNKFPMIIHQFPFFNWALVHLISWLKCLISTLTHWGSNNTREKEIMIDINCNNVKKSQNQLTIHIALHVESSTHDGCEKSLSDSSHSQDETKTILGRTVKLKPDINMKCIYKENGVEKGTKDNLEDGAMEEFPKATVSEDAILELFEASWHMR